MKQPLANIQQLYSWIFAGRQTSMETEESVCNIGGGSQPDVNMDQDISCQSQELMTDVLSSQPSESTPDENKPETNDRGSESLSLYLKVSFFLSEV